MIQKFIITTTAFFIALSPLFGEGNEDVKPVKKKILVYNFTPKKDEKKYEYYSYIIPLTIIKSLGLKENFDIRHMEDRLEFPGLKVGEKSTETETGEERNIQTFDLSSADLESLEKKYDDKMKLIYSKLKEIIESSRDDSPGYIIGGSYSIDGGKLNISIQVYDVKGRSLAELSKVSMETGAQLKDTTDDLTVKIQNQIAVLEEKNRKAFAPSPFMGLYRGISFISFGFDSGELFFLSDSKKNYSNTQFINSCLMFDITGILGVTLNINYFGTDSNRKNQSPTPLRFKSWSGIVDINLNLAFSKYMALTVSGGGGLSKNIVDVMPNNSGGPDTDPLSTKRTTDKCMKFTLSMNIHLNPVTFKVGTFYERIFFQSNPVDMYTIFAGVAYGI